MSDETYWMRPSRSRLGRRQLLSRVAVGTAGLSGAALLACSNKRSGGTNSGGQAGQGASGGARGKPQYGGTFNTSMPSNAILDPQKVSAAPQTAISGVMSRLFLFKTDTDPNAIANHDLDSDLGLSAESPDAVTWTIKLRTDAKFQNIPPANAHPVEAEDIKATFTRATGLSSNPNRGSLSMIDPTQIQMPDAHTVVFKLNFPYSPFQRTLASPAYSWIFPREVLSDAYDPAKVVIGSGPFTLESATPDVANVYKKSPTWYRTGQPYVDGMRLAIIADAAQRLAQFSAGNLDELAPGSNDVATAQQQNPKARFIKFASGTPEPISYQLGDPTSIFQDIRVRQAVSMALDRDALGKAVDNGQYLEPLYVPVYMGKWSLQVKDLDPSIAQYYQYNPAEAKKLLEAAGVTDVPLRFAYVNNGPFTTPDFIKLGQACNNMLSAAGFKISLSSIDYSKDYIDSGKGASQGFYPKDMMVFGGSSVYTEADEFLYNNFDSKTTSGHLMLKDPTLDDMIAKERTIVNETDRLTAIHNIEKYIAAKVYTVPTVGAYAFTMVQPRVQNYDYSNTLGKGTEIWAKLWLQS